MRQADLHLAAVDGRQKGDLQLVPHIFAARFGGAAGAGPAAAAGPRELREDIGETARPFRAEPLAEELREVEILRCPGRPARRDRRGAVRRRAICSNELP